MHPPIDKPGMVPGQQQSRLDILVACHYFLPLFWGYCICFFCRSCFTELWDYGLGTFFFYGVQVFLESMIPPGIISVLGQAGCLHRIPSWDCISVSFTTFICLPLASACFDRDERNDESNDDDINDDSPGLRPSPPRSIRRKKLFAA